MFGIAYTAAAMPRVNSAPRIVPMSQYPPESWYSSSRRWVTVPSRVPPTVIFCNWARPWPRLVIDSLRVSLNRTGRPTSRASTPISSSSL